MYNRYIPQQDGSYRRKQEPDAPRPGPENHRPPPPPEPPCQPGPPPVREPQEPTFGNIGNFLRRLLPKDFDTGDLIVILLLLLMAGDCEEDRSTALLTLVLYLFM